MKRSLVSLLIFTAALCNAQPFLKNETNRALTFKEMQQQFNEFRKNNDLSTSRYWKNFARYEHEMVRHANGRGEPDGFETYMQVAAEAAAWKASASSQPSPWYPTGPNVLPNNLQGYAENGIGRVNCMAFHPADTNIFYVGVAQGGLWKTTNGGQSYTPLTDQLPVTRISDILIVPNNPNTIYISVCDFAYIGKGLYLDGRKRHTHFGAGVYKSTDAGLTWNATGLTFQLTDGDGSLIKKVLVNPANSNELLACGVSGMYRSVNGGTSWTKQLDSLFWDMEQDPVNPSTIYAATGWVKNSNEGNAGIYKSTDFGQTWNLLLTGIQSTGIVQRIELAIAPSDHDFVYALCVNAQEGLYGIYQSTNAGANWTYKPPSLNILEWDQGFSPGGQGSYDLALCVNDTNENIIYTGGINIWGSNDGGTTFEPATHWTYNYGFSTIHADIHNIQIQPVSKKIFVSCDGGIYSTDRIILSSFGNQWPTTWKNMSSGMQVTSFYRLSSNKNSSGHLLAGAQDNSSFYFDGTSWSTIFGGDGMDNYMDPNNFQTLLGSSQYGNFYHSTDGGLSGNWVDTNPNSEAAEWVTPVVADYNQQGVLYIGNENMVKSTDGGLNWYPLGSIFSNTLTQQNTEISALAVSGINSNVLWAARRVRHEKNMKAIVFRSVNGGLNFTNITSNLPDTLFYTGIEAGYASTNDAVISMAGFAAGHKVYRTNNGGASWTNISYNLPNVPVNCIKYVPGSGQLLVATDLGVYYLNGGSTVWLNYSIGLPNVIVSDIEFNTALNKIYISTFGRGIWETDLQMLASIDPVSLAETHPELLQYEVYPTINDGKFTIVHQAGINAKVDVIDVQGRVVVSKQLRDQKQELALDLLPGSYYLRLSQGKSFGVKRIIVQ